MSSVRENTSKIFQYLLAVKNLTVPVDRDLSKYNPLWWTNELPNTEGCYHLGTGKNKEAWLEVHKQDIPGPPDPPKVIIDWIIGDIKNPTQKPSYRETFNNGIETIPFNDSEERTEAWEHWLADWEKWGKSNLPKYRIYQLYGELFTLNQSLQRDGESIELVWGHGLLTWLCQGQRIRRPLFATRMELYFDPQNGVFYIVPSDKGTWLETDMLSGLDIPNAERFSILEHSVQEEGLDPWDKAIVEPLCREIAYTLSPDGKVEYGDNIGQSRLVNFPSAPTIYNLPLLFVRSRTGRQWQVELKGILEAIDNGYPIPPLIAALTSTKDIGTILGVDMIGSQEDWQPVGEEILFPMAANDDQREIVKRLAANYGVSVQGPPGTGKSHTIANLICHLLAHGKRVLFTSHTDRALKVLADRIPQRVRSLCVSVTGGDTQSIKEIEGSIRAISDNLSMDTGKLNKEIAVLKQELQETRSKLASLRFKQKQAAVREHTAISFDGKDRMPIEISRWLKDNEQEHNWLPDSIPLDTTPPAEENVAKLYKLAGQLEHNDLAALTQTRPDAETLPTRHEFAELVAVWTKEEEKTVACADCLDGWKCADEFYSEIDQWIAYVSHALDNLKQFEEPWLRQIFDDILHDEMQRENWQVLSQECKSMMENINSITRNIAEHSVKLPVQPPALLKEDLLKIQEHLVQNKSLNWMFRNVFGRKLNYLLDGCLVNGSPIRTKEDVEIAIAYLDKTTKTDKLVNRWNTFITELGGESLSPNQQRLLPTLNKYLEAIDLALTWEETVIKPLTPVLDRFAIMDEVSCSEPEGLVKLKVGFEAIEQRQRLLTVTAKVEDLKRYLITGAGGKAAHDSWNQLLKALQERNTELWEKTVKQLKRLEGLEPLKKEFDQLTKVVEKSAPRWVSQVIAQGGKGVPLLPPKDWNVAWKWSQANNWLNELQAESNPEEIQRAIVEWESRESHLLEDIITKSSWARQIERTTEPQKRSLYAWIQAIRRIGKGTGKYADKHRRDAKKEMEICQGAIPVWIMPIHRVIENLKVSDNLFDVVIVDESSQSDLFALVSFFRAKKAVVVGDDMQISPESIGSDQTAVNELINRYLVGIPQKERFDLQTSLYDTSLRIFPGNIMLKEHFRCVPEIIQFSNDLSYGGAIEPLRLPKAAERLDPAVVAVRVPDGYREDSTAAINYPEAEALVNRVVDCCADEKYKGRSMGVISLQGYEQARIIEEKLRERLGDTEMIKRKIICGDAYSFQGDERDVMFLSLVAASNRRNAALTKPSDEKRFNVAASRARDQMWLFYSIDPNELNPNCMRYRLLTYCLDPKRTAIEQEKVDYLFESQFERDVYKLITARGYAVTPQVKVGRYNKRIDLVIEGLTNRLAVECDGDRWHGPEQWEADNDRQRLLERIGWKFWRVRGSVFYRDPDKAMRSLWDKLNEMGIEPKTC